MASDAQIAANRANAARSTGPRTPQGKQRASRNALKNGAFARTHGAFAVELLSDESAAAFMALRETYLALYRPAGEVQCFLVGRLALAAWRLQRLAGLEARVVAAHRDAATRNADIIQRLTAPRGPAAQDRPDPEPAPEPALPGYDPIAEAYIRDSERGNAISKLARYQNLLERSYYHALRELESRLQPPAA